MAFVFCTGMVIAGTIAMSALEFGKHSLAEVFVIAVAMLLVAQVGLWALLQFRWLAYAMPPISLACERLLLVSVPLSTSAMLLWTLFSNELVGVDSLPLAFAVLLCVQHALFGASLPSSFRSAADSATDGGELACTPLDAAWQVAAADNGRWVG